MALVRYPTRQAFAAMVEDPDYRGNPGRMPQAAPIEAMQPIHTAGS